MLHPFGSGLQYNRWTVSSLQLSHTTISAEALRASEAGGSLRGQVPGSGWLGTRPTTTAVVNVTATAKHSGAFPRSSIPLLLFAVSPRAGSDGRPLRTLVGFEKRANDLALFSISARALDVLHLLPELRV